jgi:ADP-dependent NAD(P)H-hydrate dehydratase / NAD(P)H-hydrate epimerase
MREIDLQTTQRLSIPSLTLMEKAAVAVARIVTESLSGVGGKKMLVLCGKGNNGGDGAATARLLATSKAQVSVILLGRVEDSSGDARVSFERLRSWTNESLNHDAAGAAPGTIDFFECDSEKGWEQLLASVLSAPFDVVIDALFGTGLTRPIEGIYLKPIEFMRQLREDWNCPEVAAAQIISIDIPSGLNSDSENPIGEAVQADVTVTMTAPKRANVLHPAAGLCGKLIVANIGSPAELIDAAESRLFLSDESDARRWLIQTRYTPGSYKNSHGHALVIAGSRGFTGAAALCGNAAMCAGAGLVTVATPASAQPLVATQVMPEIMTAALAETDRGAVSNEAIDYISRLMTRAEVVAIGPGLSAEVDRTRKLVRAVVEQRKTPIVVDADGLNCLAPWPVGLSGSSEHPIVLTPHPGEMLRLMGTKDSSALNDRVTTAREFAMAHQVILVLKGPRALIAAPDGRVIINATGNAGLGTAGAGDTLTGVITGFLAQSYGTLPEPNAVDSVIAALYVSGFAGDLAARYLGMRSMVASDIREHLGQAFRQLDPIGEAPTGLHGGLI